MVANGDVYSWGRGTFGRLGTGSEADHLFPVRISFDSDAEKRVKIVAIAAGAYHSLAVSGYAFSMFCAFLCNKLFGCEMKSEVHLWGNVI